MAKLQSLSVLAALCFFAALAGTTLATKPESTFVVEGKVYCDNCRAGFETTLTEYLADAKVRLECRNATTHEILHNVEGGATDATGTYKIEIKHNHEEEICEVVLVSSPEAGCSEIKKGRDRARVLITDNSGMSSNIRYANSLGFLKTEPLEICGALLAQYALGDEE